MAAQAAAGPSPAEAPSERRGPALERLELRSERLGLTLRVTWAFHAREVRFEKDTGAGYARMFPETFSFHPDRNDPAELYLQLDDLATKPSVLSEAANRRDAEVMSARLVLALPRYLESVLRRLEGEGRLSEESLVHVYEDVALATRIAQRFLRSRVDDGPGVRVSQAHFQKLGFTTLCSLMRRQVPDSYLRGYVDGTIDPVDPADDLSEAGFFYTMASEDSDRTNRLLVRLTERAFYDWLEGVVLDETNTAIETEGSPFHDRETEVRRAITVEGNADVERGDQLVPFLRRRASRDGRRVLEKLEAWYLRRYDVYHAAVMIHHADSLERGVDDATRVLSRHRTRNYVAAIAVLAAPFVAATFFYDSAPRWFDVICSAEIVLADAAILWFLLYRFCWKRDLTFFHSSVPRIGAGIIVGYLPIFFIDEIWYIARESFSTIAILAFLLGFTNLLYLYVEVKRRLGDTTLAFARARQIFLLGVLQSLAIGLLLTGLIGGFMAVRNWQLDDDAPLPLAALAEALPHFAGELPMIVGLEPFFAYPSAVLLMTFLSFFIGTFLQLMWEELPITEPL